MLDATSQQNCFLAVVFDRAGRGAVRRRLRNTVPTPGLLPLVMLKVAQVKGVLSVSVRSLTRT